MLESLGYTLTAPHARLPYSIVCRSVLSKGILLAGWDAGGRKCTVVRSAGSLLFDHWITELMPRMGKHQHFLLWNKDIAGIRGSLYSRIGSIQVVPRNFLKLGFLLGLPSPAQWDSNGFQMMQPSATMDRCTRNE